MADEPVDVLYHNNFSRLPLSCEEKREACCDRMAFDNITKLYLENVTEKCNDGFVFDRSEIWYSAIIRVWKAEDFYKEETFAVGNHMRSHYHQGHRPVHVLLGSILRIARFRLSWRSVYSTLTLKPSYVLQNWSQESVFHSNCTSNRLRSNNGDCTELVYVWTASNRCGLCSSWDIRHCCSDR